MAGAALLAAGGVALGSVSPAGASTTATTRHHASDRTRHGRRHHYTVGIVESKGTSTFTIVHGAATVVVDVSSTTTYREEGVSTPSLADVAVGDHVRVRGTVESGSSPVLDALVVHIRTTASPGATTGSSAS